MSEVLTSTLPKTQRKLLTYDDYVTFPDSDGSRKEIIEGKLFTTPALATIHQRILLRLAKMLDDYINQNDLGTVLISPFDVIFSNMNIMQPDILYISKENMSVLTDLNAKGAPDLVIGILFIKKRINLKKLAANYWKVWNWICP